MKRIFFADDGVTVTNVAMIAADAEPVDGTTDVADDYYVGPGMVRDGDTFAMPAAEAPVPASVTPRQMRLALIQAGYDEAVEAFLEMQPKEVKVAWEYATTVDREDPLIAMAVEGLSLSQDQADGLFRLAATF